MNIIKRYRERMEASKDALIREEFKVTEKGGSLWLTHRGVAFRRIEDHHTAEVVANLLKDARDAAVKHERL